MDNQSLQPTRRQNEFENSRTEYRIGVFPKEFERRWLDYIDRRFAFILLISFLIHFLTALYFAFNPPATIFNEAEIDRIQKQYASLVLDKQAMVEEKKYEEPIPRRESEVEQSAEAMAGDRNSQAKGKSKGGGSSETRLGTAEERKAQYGADLESRRRTREQISEEVSSKGLLGLLSGTGSAATGTGVVDVLGEVDQSSSNLDHVLDRLDGMKIADGSAKAGGGGAGTGGSEGYAVKGTRETAGGGIDDLISERGATKSSKVERKGQLVVSALSVLENEDGKRSDSRDPDEVSAVVNGHNAAIQYCYERELKRNPLLKGKLVVRFIITPDGRVRQATILSSTLDNERVERCVLNRIERWDDFGAIDPKKGEATFRQVYTFGY